MAVVKHNGTEYEAEDAELFTKKDNGDHVAKFVLADKPTQELLDALVDPVEPDRREAFEVTVADVTVYVEPHDVNIVLHDVLNQMTGKQSEKMQVALITDPARVYYTVEN